MSQVLALSPFSCCCFSFFTQINQSAANPKREVESISTVKFVLLNPSDEKMIITSSKERDFQAKVEGDAAANITKLTKAQASSSSSRQWSAILKNPRIVRVSRAFGGKDRHSKVCTVRGLRDRRIRLSVPTAIQLYDLQERLGLNQPSKVIDWLIDATKDEIDKLPPLQMPPGNFSQFHQPNLLSPPQSSFASLFKGGINKINYGLGDDQLIGNSSRGWESDATNAGGKLKEVDDQGGTINVEKTKWMRITNDEGQNQDGSTGGNYSHNVSAQNFFPITSNSSFPFPYLNNYYHHWEPSNLSLSQFGSHGFSSQTEGANTSNLAAFPPPFPLPSAGSQLFLGPPAATPSIFAPYPSYVTNIPGQTNHFQLLNSSSNPLINPSLNPFSSSPLNAATRVHLHSQNDERQPNKGCSTGS